MPASQFAQKYQDSLDQLLNKIFKVKVIEVDRKNNRLIFSEKAVSEAKLIARKKKLLKKVKIGDKIYNSLEQPLMVILSQKEKREIGQMPTHHIKYAVFPLSYDPTTDKGKLDILEWIKTDD